MNTARVEKRWGWVSRYIDDMLIQSKNNLEKYGSSIEVYSAIRDETIDFNATKSLINLSEILNSNNKNLAREKAQEIKNITIEIIKKYYQDFEIDEWLEKFINIEFQGLIDAIENHNISEKLCEKNDYSVWNFSILWFGEIFRAKLQVFLLTREWINVVYIDPEKADKELNDLWEVLSFYKDEVARLLGTEASEKLVMIAWGFMKNLKWWINGMIGEGFTDTITGLIALGLLDTDLFQTVVFEIQKDVDWVLSTNPNDLDDAERVKLVETLSIEFAIRLFGEHGANSWLLNKSTINKYVIEALQNDPRFTVEIKNPNNLNGKKTTIQNSVELQEPKVDIIASRDWIRKQYRHLLWLGSTTSLYILWENLGVYSTELMSRASNVLLHHDISGANFSIHFWLDDALVVSFDNDSKKNDNRNLNAQEKSKISLDILHYYLIEEPDSEVGTYTPSFELAQVA